MFILSLHFCRNYKCIIITFTNIAYYFPIDCQPIQHLELSLLEPINTKVPGLLNEHLSKSEVDKVLR